jgi:hypothetical protein
MPPLPVFPSVFPPLLNPPKPLFEPSVTIDELVVTLDEYVPAVIVYVVSLLMFGEYTINAEYAFEGVRRQYYVTRRVCK